MGMVLDKQKFEEGIAVLMSSASGDCVEALETIGSVLKTEDPNDMIEQVLHNGALFQQAWNEEYRPSVDGVIADFSASIGCNNYPYQLIQTLYNQDLLPLHI